MVCRLDRERHEQSCQLANQDVAVQVSLARQACHGLSLLELIGLEQDGQETHVRRGVTREECAPQSPAACAELATPRCQLKPGNRYKALTSVARPTGQLYAAGEIAGGGRLQEVD